MVTGVKGWLHVVSGGYGRLWVSWVVLDGWGWLWGVNRWVVTSGHGWLWVAMGGYEVVTGVYDWW